MLNITNTLLTKLTIGLLFLSSQLALWAAEPAPSAEWAAIQAECAQQYTAFKASQITAAHDRILLTAENCPTLYQALTKLAARVGVSLPPEVWLICVAPQSCNAGVYRTIIDRYHTKLQLALGYELIKICNEREFIALMAHEFGHLKLGHLECGLGD
ncbi:MAG TPA: M48 family metalloprotease, partial [Candidatus Babeliales bacterium]|nr:M48 family metalloprotease [Candidatus Babeliales bacterium]